MEYKDSGVDIDAATLALGRARDAIRSTWGPAVASDVGSFGGLYRRPGGGYLVSSIDGVGTKLKVALAARQVGGVGADLVNHCVNDILVQGARPLFFLDYFAAGRLDGAVFVDVIEGMARACRENGCALIGGETAEMPGLYHGDDFDLAGCIIGEVSDAELLGPQHVVAGMEIYGWNSSGLHTNGYSLARRALIEGDAPLALDRDPGGLGTTLANALLAVHRSYLHQVLQLRDRIELAALCHLTGGGFTDNIPRVLPDGLAVEIDAGAWEVPAIFGLIARRGGVSLEEMRRVFNLGIGMLAFVPPLGPQALTAMAEPPVRLGRVIPQGSDPARVRFVGAHRGLS